MIDVSIILGTYNRKDLLIKCINSIKNSSIGLNYEIIINDAGSTDGTINVLKKLESDSIKIIYSKSKTNPTQAYNECFKLASGKYIVWMSDDLEAQDMAFLNMFNFMEKNDEKTLGGFYVKNANQQNMIKILGIHQKKILETENKDLKKELQAKIDRIKKSLGFSIPEFKNRVCPTVGCIRSDFLKQLNFWNIDYLFYAQDLDLNFRVARAGGLILPCKDAKLIHNMIDDDLRKHNVGKSALSDDGEKFQLVSQRFGIKCDKMYPKILFCFQKKYNLNLFKKLLLNIKKHIKIVLCIIMVIKKIL